MIYSIKETTPINYRTFDITGISGEELQLLVEAIHTQLAVEPVNNTENSEWRTRVLQSIYTKFNVALSRQTTI